MFFCSHSNFLSSSILYTPSFCLLSYPFYHLFIFFHSAFLLSCIILCSFLSLFSILFFSSSIHSLCLPFFYLSIHSIWHSVHSIWLFHPSLHLRKTIYWQSLDSFFFRECYCLHSPFLHCCVLCSSRCPLASSSQVWLWERLQADCLVWVWSSSHITTMTG